MKETGYYLPLSLSLLDPLAGRRKLWELRSYTGEWWLTNGLVEGGQSVQMKPTRGLFWSPNLIHFQLIEADVFLISESLIIE